MKPAICTNHGRVVVSLPVSQSSSHWGLAAFWCIAAIELTLADLPWNRVGVRIQLCTRKFFCNNGACERRIFTEPLPQLVERYARKTLRMQEALYLIGYALGGEAGARVAIGLGLKVSSDTLLARVRQVRSSRVTPQTSVRVLRVDAWAYRRGQRYGTILMELERRRLVDLLPDRSQESLAAWLKRHPGVEILCRDRAGCYAEGATQGAPEATQVADRRRRPISNICLPPQR